MASNGWKRAMHFLGLVEEYDDDYNDMPTAEPMGAPPLSAEPPAAPRSEPSNVRRIPTAGSMDDDMAPAGMGSSGMGSSGMGSSGTGPASSPAPVAPTGTVNVLGGPRAEEPPAPSGPRVADHVHITSPSTFNDVEEVGENFRDRVPVLMNLQGASETVAKRLLDFASGLIYGLDGRIERKGDRIFLLTPADVEISAGELSRLQDRGLTS